ncbi:MAG: GldG family protein [Burkholderiales bacterium]
MKVNRSLRFQILIQNGIFVGLLLGLVMTAGWLTKDIKTQWDLTQGKRNTLSQASADVLKSLAGPVKITAYATAQDAEGDVRKTVQTFLGPFQRAKSDLELHFIDPREQPQKAQAAGIRANGELVVEYNGRNEHLTSLTEQDLANLLLRLARSAERQIVYLDGHGERKLDGNANHDLGEFGAQMRNKGFRTAPLNLALAQDIPDNVSVLVIASPRVDVLPGETAKLRKWLAKGGSLLWLIDTESIRGLQPVADELGLRLPSGVVIDPQAGGLKLPATFALATQYGRHRITENSTVTSVFPHARQIATTKESKWIFSPLVEVAQGGWLESSGIPQNVTFDPGSDTRGPIIVAATLERDVADRKQRVVLVGSGHFLANQYIGTLGNLDLGINMINWLAGDEALITVQPRVRGDLTLEFSRGALSMIGLGFLIGLPLAFLIAGGWIWWHRRKA